MAGPGGFWRSVRTIGWAFLGVRKRSGHDEDLSRIGPAHIIVAGLLGGVAFVLLLVLAARWAAAG